MQAEDGMSVSSELLPFVLVAANARFPGNERWLSGQGRALVSDQFAGAKRAISVHASAGREVAVSYLFQIFEAYPNPKVLLDQGVRLILLPYARIQFRGWAAEVGFSVWKGPEPALTIIRSADQRAADDSPALRRSHNHLD